jgi:hypothetical protein
MRQEVFWSCNFCIVDHCSWFHSCEPHLAIHFDVTQPMGDFLHSGPFHRVSSFSYKIFLFTLKDQILNLLLHDSVFNSNTVQPLHNSKLSFHPVVFSCFQRHQQFLIWLVIKVLDLPLCKVNYLPQLDHVIRAFCYGFVSILEQIHEGNVLLLNLNLWDDLLWIMLKWVVYLLIEVTATEASIPNCQYVWVNWHYIWNFRTRCSFWADYWLRNSSDRGLSTSFRCIGGRVCASNRWELRESTYQKTLLKMVGLYYYCKINSDWFSLIAKIDWFPDKVQPSDCFSFFNFCSQTCILFGCSLEYLLILSSFTKQAKCLMN